MSIPLDALMNFKRLKFSEIKRYLNDNIKNITTETELKTITDRLSKYEWELEAINKEILITEKREKPKNNT